MMVYRAAHINLDAILAIFKCSLSFAPGLNEELVQLLLIRDELHTEQDAMLVDIEDLTRSVMPPLPKGKKERSPGWPNVEELGQARAPGNFPLLP